MTGCALAVAGMSVSYGDFLAVQRADFEVGAGQCVAVVGPNGNGKSSIALGIVGLAARHGTVHVDGELAPPSDPTWMVRHGAVLVPERRQLFASMTVIDNILLGTFGFSRRLGRSRKAAQVTEALELFPELHNRFKQIAGTLSGGQQQMVAIARGVATGARILLLDEPCLGLAEVVSVRVYEALKAIRDEGRTLILIEENPVRALRLSDQVVRVRNGIAEAASAQIAG
jgi:branched-chain amino acid transport system ATP-binding protein